MNILFLYNESPIDGKGNTDLHSVTKKLEQRDHNISMILKKEKQKIEKQSVYSILPNEILAFLIMPIIMMRLLKIVNVEKPDIIISEGGWYFPLVLNFFSKFNKTPFIFNFRGLVLEVFTEWKNKPFIILWICKMLIKINNRIYRRNKFVIATNQTLCKYYEDILGIDVPLVGTHPIDLNQYKVIEKEEKALIRKKFGIDENKISILYSGAIFKWHFKSIKNLIDVFMELSNQYPIQLIITGWGDKKNDIVDYVNSKKGFDNVKILPFLDHSEIFKVVSSCDISIDPFIRKFPMDKPPPSRLIDYMLSGTCVITTSSANNREWIKHKENGLLFTGDSNDLKKQLEFILQNKDLISKYSLAARKTIETEHNRENQIEGLEEHLTKIIKKCIDDPSSRF